MELVLDWVEIASLVVAILGIPAAAVGVLTYRKAKQAQNLVRATANFGHVHEYVRMHQRELRSASWSATPAHHRSRDVELLAQPGWIPDKPIPLSGVTLEWIPRRSRSTTASHGAEAVESAARRSPYGGLSYSSALTKQVDTSSLFNGFVYRPLAIEPTTPGLRIAFTEGRYFDYLDQSEFLAHELGAQLLAGKAPSGGRYRSYISNPFDLEKRSTSLGINTLTIRKSAHGNHGFFMHRRGGRRLVNESELLHVVPAGEFAPSNIAPESRPADFDIFRTILREYAEEFLNLPEADGRSGSELDFERDHPFGQLMEAEKAGSLQISVLGIGLDSACWKPELLTVAIFEADVFDAAFASLVTENAEGVLLTGKGKRGLQFTEANIRRYVTDTEVSATGAACLNLTWRHRVSLGLSSA